jgi:cell division topological specificity factor
VKSDTVFSKIRDLFSSKDRASSSLAKNRLQFVLVQDRAGLTNDELALFKKEMISVIEKYFVIDEKGFDISYKRTTDSTVLLINSPIVVKRQEAIGHAVGARGKLGKKTSKAGSAEENEVPAGAEQPAAN